MQKQYPLRIDEDVYARAKSKAALKRVSLKEAITTLLRLWTDDRLTLRKSKNEKIEVSEIEKKLFE
jgi:hypothetical protein